MKKQELNMSKKAISSPVGKDNTSRLLLIAAVVLYSISLVLLANLALADNSAKIGALIKVNNRLDGDAFATLNADVKSVSGNVLAIDIPVRSIASINEVIGICASHVDHKAASDSKSNFDSDKANYAGTGVVVGILDNLSDLGTEASEQLKKVENASNVGFISYVNTSPSSTVIMRNLRTGESNLVQALLYMEEYAKTVEKPLIIDLRVGAEEMNNPLFVQVCQKFADAGVQFLGTALSTGSVSTSAPLQMAFSTFNAATGQITDQSDFWAIQEVKEQQIMLLGSDDKTCSIFFETEAGFDKVYLSNNSEDLVMVTTISADGNVNYYHVSNKESALIPRKLMNGTPMMEDGLAGIYPYHSKGVLFNGAVADKQFVALKEGLTSVSLTSKSDMQMSVGSPNAQTLSMSLDKLSSSVSIQIKDESGAIVYHNQPDEETQSLKTRIDLSSGVGGLYFLDLTSPGFHQTFALLID